MRNNLSTLFLLTIMLLAVPAYGLPISGIMWSVPASTADNVPTLGNVPGPGAVEWGTFNASSIMFSGDHNYSLGGFLNSFGAASNISYMNGASAGSNLTDVLFDFEGSAVFTNGMTFNVFHDDGVNLYVNGVLVLGAPNVTSPITTPYTYTGPSGTYNFDFIYANGPATMADFQTTLVTPSTLTTTPEPSTYLLLGTGLVACFLFRRHLTAPSGSCT